MVKGDLITVETEENRTLFLEMFISSINLFDIES